MLTKRRALLHCLLPLLVSLGIYTLFRTPDTVVNRLLGFVWPSLVSALPLRFSYAQWPVYNLPGALWMYAFLWMNTLSGRRWLRVLPLALALGIEAVQLVHLTDGTFDLLDVAFYLLAAGVFVAWGGLAAPALVPGPAAPQQRRRAAYRVAFVFFVAIVALSDVWVK